MLEWWCCPKKFCFTKFFRATPPFQHIFICPFLFSLLPAIIKTGYICIALTSIRKRALSHGLFAQRGATGYSRDLPRLRGTRDQASRRGNGPQRPVSL